MMLMCNFELYIVVAIGKSFLLFLKLLLHQLSNYYWLRDFLTTRRAKFFAVQVSKMTMLLVFLIWKQLGGNPSELSLSKIGFVFCK
jgi:hypothetical protein